ncbi:RsmB/NOP family class I SAM-dependent RNA methyltransferase [Ruegeria sp. 2012CJ41-6]|uniref:RsmB/NOP family class I SAM-dependent RNA methyltransferase n=1 Tax=Ruegeria spongiae TaxID=2942209 RepID=A0ABT0PX52_9RHOB|nr:RsmB/NOP family class I SAM-dependent RNA methyltransferase [Ruegeria spongiae]MCL6282166.1 RsmB/NOP family class I SAM-dependent RNA methyltransferase [Ruegeria spongiae]
MIPAARMQAAIELLDEISAGKPVEQALTGWARRSRFAGSGDRAAVRDHVFEALRRKRSFAAIGGAATGRGLMLGALRQSGGDPSAVFTGARHCPAPLSDAEQGGGRDLASDAERYDMPDWLWPEFSASLGDEAVASAAALQRRAPVWLRANLARKTREAAVRALADDNIKCDLHPSVSTAIRVLEGERKITASTAFRDGLVELQDASSQAVIAALPLQPGMRVLDYCAGGGGKSLALAATRGVQVCASDIDPRRMRDLPDRAARAGVIVEVLDPDAVAHAGPFDLVLVDAPCSGSGAWRRSPAAKWALTQDRLDTLTGIQADVLDRAAALTSAGGLLAYATCAVLSAENTRQVQDFTARHTTWRCAFEQSWPVSDLGDGFFTAHLTR